jgi:hypothetical protein
MFIYSGCLRFGYKMVSQGHLAGSIPNMAECQSHCNKTLECHLFEWDHDKKMCNFFYKPSDAKFDVTKASNVLIGVSNCQNIEEMWLKMNYVEIADPADQTDSKPNEQNIRNLTE